MNKHPIDKYIKDYVYQCNIDAIQQCETDLMAYGVAVHTWVDGKLIRVDPTTVYKDIPKQHNV